MAAETVPEIIEIHTSDRTLFKRCRRRYGWASTTRENLIRLGPDQMNFFIGTGFHFALEDWWGYRRFAHPALAFAAYYDAQKPEDMPDDAESTLDLVPGMLSYYIEDWLEEHPEEFETLWVDGVPQVEVEVAIDITQLLLEAATSKVTIAWTAAGIISSHNWLEKVLNGRQVHYISTYDRVVMDRHERLFGLDYKTAGQFDELNLQTNPQAGAYDWSMDLFYTPAGFKPEGIIWQQHKKALPEPPKLVNAGKKDEGFSTDKRQSTTYRLYKRAVLGRHGTIPERYLEMLATLGNAQSYEGDRFIRRDILRRNQYQRGVEQDKIIAEVLEMLDPNLPLYPNPTKDCSWDCPFKAPCLAMDDGSDYQFILGSEYTQWKGYKDDWRERVKYPKASTKAGHSYTSTKPHLTLV